MPIRERLSSVPVLAVRDAVHFPDLINTVHVVREPSRRAVKRSLEESGIVLVLSQRDMSVEEPTSGDLYRVGTISEVLQASPLPDGSLRVVLRGLYRATASHLTSRRGQFWATAEEAEEIAAEGIELSAMMRGCIDSYTSVVHLNKQIPPESLQAIAHHESPGILADSILHHLPIKSADKQALLEEMDQAKRLEAVLKLLLRERQVLELNSSILQKVELELGNAQREFFLREQLKVIQTELRVHEDRVGESEEYRAKIHECGMPPEATEKALTELRRLDRTPPASAEGMVLRNYLDTLVSLPWSELSEDRLDVTTASDLLDSQHFGLKDVKERILDHLSVRQLKRSLRGPILCFVGPPGVGKTSIGRSIAQSMGRKFALLSLGGVRDEAEIRGHRRTYVGSLPGRIIQALRDTGTRNPVIMLDEIDKLSHAEHGDPVSALLEALDPQQNQRFVDHYVEAPFDLSAVMFIATANTIESIPHPLRDRMEMIPFPGYSEAERLYIAREFLLPRQREEHGLSEEQLEVTEDALRRLVDRYTREAGVRGLDRQVAGLCRKAARRIASGVQPQVQVTPDDLEGLLGVPPYQRERAAETGELGLTVGLVVGPYGGDTVPIEVSLLEPANAQPALLLTGNLGDVMKESAQAAITLVRSLQRELAPDRPFRFDTHIHVPEAAIPKDGPSAGLTLVVALASALSLREVRAGLAMTGEVTLRGRVLAVGGIREKLLAAHRAGYREVLIPAQNQRDLEEVPQETREALTIHLVENVRDAIKISLS